MGKTASIGAKTNGNGALSYNSSSNKIVKVGNATITIKAAETGTHKAASKQVNVTVAKGANTLAVSAVKKSVTISYAKVKSKAQATSNLKIIKKGQGAIIPSRPRCRSQPLRAPLPPVLTDQLVDAVERRTLEGPVVARDPLDAAVDRDAVGLEQPVAQVVATAVVEEVDAPVGVALALLASEQPPHVGLARLHAEADNVDVAEQEQLRPGRERACGRW
jgi:hypothetical protein